MSYQSPVGGVPDPFGYRVEGSQGQPQGGGQPPEEPPDNKGLIGAVLQAMRKAFDNLIERLGESFPGKGGKRGTLSQLKTSLDLLKVEDRSQDVHFLNDLSLSWNRSLEESLDFNQDALAVFNLFVKKMNHYPENQRHTFGYYLTEYAGQKWVPFPYMELVQKIHREHEMNPAGSALTEWTRLLEDTLKLLNSSS
ncbi:MAG: hypothetical protein K1X28_08325 [Parachlamydiales bacterium]|nr:hypothetical protein [Parachlamydiales bacterium]